MGVSMKELGIDQLSPAQRIELALAIWESLGDDRPKGGLSQEQRSELARRNAEMDANPGCAMTWEQMRADLEDNM